MPGLGGQSPCHQLGYGVEPSSRRLAGTVDVLRPKDWLEPPNGSHPPSLTTSWSRHLCSAPAPCGPCGHINGVSV